MYYMTLEAVLVSVLAPLSCDTTSPLIHHCILNFQAIVWRGHLTFGASAGTMPALLTHDVSGTFNGSIAFLRLRDKYGDVT